MIEKYFQDFDPFLSNVVFNAIPDNKSSEQSFDKAKFVAILRDKYEKDDNFRNKLKESVLDPRESLKNVDQNVIKRICDLNLLYTLIVDGFQLKLNKFRKTTGRALELVVESILKWKLGESSELDYEFVDWNGFDYLIFDKTQYDWIVGIQCKIILRASESGYLSYKKAIQSIKEPHNLSPLGIKAIMFCGWAEEKEKEKIRKAFESENLGFYYLLKSAGNNKIDETFFSFIKAIEDIDKNQNG